MCESHCDHSSLITFLRPGFLEILTTSKTLSYYIEEGTVEFYKNKLLILSSTVNNKKNFSSNEITKKLEEAQKKAEENRKELFNNYITDGKKNWEKNESHFKGSYISDDMAICSKLTEDK